MEPLRVRLKWAQARVFKSKKRFRVVVAGRRFGKTFLAGPELLVCALGAPDRVAWYVFPTYRQAKDIAWKRLKSLCRPYASAINETTLTIDLINGSEIALKGADKPDSLRGKGLDLLILDEYADIAEEAWEEVLRPALSDRRGRALFIGTPKGWNHFKAMFDRGMSTLAKWAQWESWRFTTLQGGNVPPEEIEEARATMSPRTFRQEYEASFEAIEGRVYYAFNRAQFPEGNLADVKVPDHKDRSAEIHVGMDFNVNPMTAVIGLKVAGQLHLIGEIVLPDSNTEEMCRVLDQRFPSNLWRGRIVIHPDPACRQRKTSAKIGQTDLTMLRRWGFRTLILPHLVVDGINDVNAMLLNAAGRRRLLISEEGCPNVINGLDGLAYKKGTKEPDAKSEHIHIMDALRYMVHNLFPMVTRAATVEPFSV